MAEFCSQLSFILGMFFFYLTVGRLGDHELSQKFFWAGFNLMLASGVFWILGRRK